MDEACADVSTLWYSSPTRPARPLHSVREIERLSLRESPGSNVIVNKSIDPFFDSTAQYHCAHTESCSDDLGHVKAKARTSPSVNHKKCKRSQLLTIRLILHSKQSPLMTAVLKSDGLVYFDENRSLLMLV